MELEEALRHARGIAGECHVNSRLWDRAEMAVPHYLWTLGTRKDRRGWCSACKRWMRLKPERMTPGYAAFDPYMEKFDGDEDPFLPVLYSGLQEHLFRERYNGTTDHLTTGTCPQCGAWVQFRSIYKGHKSLWDRLFLIEYAKSAIEPRSAIVCVGLEIDVAWKHMDGLEPDVPMEITPRELCVFRYGQGADRFVREATWTGDGWEMRWAHRRECVSGFAPGRGLYQPGIQVRLDDESYRNAIAGTPFEHILADEGLLQETEAGDYYDRITFAARVAKYPCIEYLNRLGMTQLARQAIDKTCGKTLNLRGRTARQVLRLTGDEWAEAKGKKLRLTRETLAARAFVRKKGLRMNMELCAWVGAEREGVETLRRLVESPVDAVKAVKYCRKKDVRLADYGDHLDMLAELGMDPREHAMPGDFYAAHGELATRIQHVKQRDKDKRIADRIRKGELDAYFFGALGLTLRPMFSGAEVVQEGTRQSHCVGSYVDQYAGGGCVLCVLREDNALDRSLYTVEFGKDGQLKQCRGYKNDRTDEGRERRKDDEPRLALFWRLFDEARGQLERQRAAKRKKKRKEAAA